MRVLKDIHYCVRSNLSSVKKKQRFLAAQDEGYTRVVEDKNKAKLCSERKTSNSVASNSVGKAK